MQFYKLLLIFVCFTHLVYASPSITYLKGTCSSGKSHLIRSLQNQTTDLQIVDEDAIMHKAYVEAVSIRFPIEFSIIKQVIANDNLYHALREKDFLFKEMASSDDIEKAINALTKIQDELNEPQKQPWKQEVSRSIDGKVLKEIHEALSLQKNVLLDSWYIKPKHLEKHFPKTKVNRVLIYCSLQNAYERFIKRNKQALMHQNLSEKRYLRQLAGSFFSMYQISSNPLQPIKEIKKHELDQVLNAMYNSLEDQRESFQKSYFTFDEIPRSYFLTIKMNFLQVFDGSSPLFISPKEKQDLIIDNSTDDIQESINALKALLECKGNIIDTTEVEKL